MTRLKGHTLYQLKILVSTPHNYGDIMGCGTKIVKIPRSGAVEKRKTKFHKNSNLLMGSWEGIRKFMFSKSLIAQFLLFIIFWKSIGYWWNFCPRRCKRIVSGNLVKDLQRDWVLFCLCHTNWTIPQSTSQKVHFSNPNENKTHQPNQSLNCLIESSLPIHDFEINCLFKILFQIYHSYYVTYSENKKN